jgi:hypothetical protein
MEPGEWYVVKRADETLYFAAIENQKNGGMAGVLATIDHTRLRAKPKFKKYSVSKFEVSRLAPAPGGFWTWIDKGALPSAVTENLP